MESIDHFLLSTSNFWRILFSDSVFKISEVIIFTTNVIVLKIYWVHFGISDEIGIIRNTKNAWNGGFWPPFQNWAIKSTVGFYLISLVILRQLLSYHFFRSTQLNMLSSQFGFHIYLYMHTHTCICFNRSVSFLFPPGWMFSLLKRTTYVVTFGRGVPDLYNLNSTSGKRWWNEAKSQNPPLPKAKNMPKDWISF